jgi:NAD(P)H-hydrate epimerase
VIGRHLHQRGCRPVFFFLVAPDTLKGDSAVNLHIINKLGLPFHVVNTAARVETIPSLLKPFESKGLSGYVIIDAIFGIGLCREVTGHFADIIQLINTSSFGHDIPVVSVDTPSGMDADTGKILGTCVRADYTATYCCAKPGQFIHGGSPWTGKLHIIDIGIPPEAIERANITTELATADTFTALSRPLLRKKASHKGSHGHLLILAGSAGKTGAAVLTARGALRSGAGLVSLCVPHDLNTVFETMLTEAMTIPLPNSSHFLSIADWDFIEQQSKTKQALVIGPGIGREPGTAELVLHAYHTVECPVVFDADALTLLAASRDRLHAPAGPRIFTPHPGELARLLDKTTDDIQDNRLEAAISGCRLFQNDRHDIVLILKGAGTIIAGAEGSATINTTGNPGMATGGMGDVLSGVIGALVCQGLSPLDAAIGGVYLHGAAADRLYEKIGAGFVASEVADMIPSVVKNHLSVHKSLYHSIGRR